MDTHGTPIARTQSPHVHIADTAYGTSVNHESTSPQQMSVHLNRNNTTRGLIPIDPILIIAYFFIMITLFYATIEDLRFRRISTHYVIALYLIVIVSVILGNRISLEATYCFLFSFVIFLVISLVSKGGFGIGDALVIGSLGWYLHDFTTLRTFMFILGVISVIWATSWFIYYKKKHDINFLTRATMDLPIEQVRPGMVLLEDNFMRGLRQKEIDRMKQSGVLIVSIKQQPLPFIPVIFLAMLLMPFSLFF